MVAAVSVVVMPLLARATRRVAEGIDSAAMRADSRQADFCTYLSAILLGGLLLNAVFGWWWADPLAGLVMVPIVAKEGIDGSRGRAARSAGAGRVPFLGRRRIALKLFMHWRPSCGCHDVVISDSVSGNGVLPRHGLSKPGGPVVGRTKVCR